MCCDRHVHHEALLPAILGHEADAGAHRVDRHAATEPAPADEDGARVVGVDAERSARNLAAPGPDQARQGATISPARTSKEMSVEDALRG